MSKDTKTTLKFDEGGAVTLVEETALTEITSIVWKYDGAYLRDTVTLTPKRNGSVEKFIEQAALVQSKLPADTQIIVDAFVLPRDETKGPAW